MAKKKKSGTRRTSGQTRKKSAGKGELVPARGSEKSDDVGLPDGYAPLLAELKVRVRSAQLKAAVSVNRELIFLYWHIGSEILRCQNEQGWGAKVVERLSRDLRAEFPEMRGLSRTNLLYMRAFADVYPDEQVVQQLAGQIPWFHNCLLLDRVKDPEARQWYARKTIEHGWSRSILTTQIETQAYERAGRAITNFDRTLPPEQSDLAHEVLKDPYMFDFLTLADDAVERDLERGLVQHIEKFLLELGVGFAFVGRQVRLDLGGDEYAIDLLFYHLRLRCFFVIDLKMKPFKPEDAGKMNFYLSAVDDLMRHPDDEPSIGLLLCRDRNGITAEYALRDIGKPIGVAEWQTRLVDSLPPELQGRLPSIEDLEKELR
jgi:predicted nuclease of restriction endonuclease-like (RecB) superfamily